MAYTYESLKNEYKSLWDTMKIIRDANELHRIAEKVKSHKEVYKKVEKSTGVPWQMVAVIHLREAGESDIGKWRRVLHNGERIIGTGRKTRLVPKGQGPFSNWHDAAVHALKMKKFDQISKWSVDRILWALEPYNGYGYRRKGLRSPYLWASTNHQQRGKYVRDGVFDRSVMDRQIGCAALLKYLEVDKKTVITSENTGAGTVIVVGGAAATQTPVDWIPWVIGGTIVIALVAWLGIRWYKHLKGKYNV